MAHARVEVVKVKTKIEIMQAVAARIALRIVFSPRYGHRTFLTLWLGACAGGTI